MPRLFRSSAALLVVCVVCCVLPAARAWWAVPHMMVADLAERHLSPQNVRLVRRLLEGSLPSYGDTATPVPAALWADEIKGDGMHEYDDWHFLDIPYSNGYDAPPLGDVKSGVNIVAGLTHSRGAVLGVDDTTEYSRALMVRMIVHLIGDLHQPLHCAAMFTPNHHGGDHGGNLIHVEGSTDASVNNLHKFLDSGADGFPQYPVPTTPPYYDNGLKTDDGLAFVANLTDMVEALHPRESFSEDEIAFGSSTADQAADKFEAWCYESYHKAVDVVYDGVSDEDGPFQITDAYRQRVQTLVKRQVALGGYRLANVLNKFLDQYTVAERALDGGSGDADCSESSTVTTFVVFFVLSFIANIALGSLLYLKCKQRASIESYELHEELV